MGEPGSMFFWCLWEHSILEKKNHQHATFDTQQKQKQSHAAIRLEAIALRLQAIATDYPTLLPRSLAQTA